MRKMTAVLLAAGMLLAISTSVMAEVQNVRLGGDIRTRMYYTKGLYSVDVDEKKDDFFFRQRTRVSAEADLTDNVWVVSTVEADGVWGQQVVVGVVAQPQLEHGVQVHKKRFARLQLTSRGRRAGSRRQAGPVSRCDLVAAGEGPLPLAARFAHGMGRQPGELGLGFPAPRLKLAKLKQEFIPVVYSLLQAPQMF